MKAGGLRRRVTIQQKAEPVDADGFPNHEQWADVCTVWASVDPTATRARQFYMAAAINDEKTVVVTIRYRPGIASDMRVLYGSRVFTIWAVLDTEERHAEIQLVCREVTASV